MRSKEFEVGDWIKVINMSSPKYGMYGKIVNIRKQSELVGRDYLANGEVDILFFKKDYVKQRINGISTETITWADKKKSEKLEYNVAKEIGNWKQEFTF